MLQVVLRHASKYLSGSVISSFIGLLMTKYYTAVYTTSEFGVLAMYLVMFKILLTLVSLNMDSSSTRYYFDYREKQRDVYLSTIFWFISFQAFVVFILGLGLMPFISNWISPDSTHVYLLTLFAGIGAVYVSFLTRVLYNEHRSTSVLKHTLFQSVVNHSASFLFISIIPLGVFGRILGQGLGYFLNAISLIREFSKENLFRLKKVFKKKMAKETFLLALPGAITNIQSIFFVYLDRVFLKYYYGDSMVGIYTLGFMLGQALSLVNEAISQAIFPKVFTDMSSNYEKARDELQKFSYLFYFGLILITVSVSLLSPFIVKIFSNSNYYGAIEVIPFIIAGFMMGGFYKIPSLILSYHKIVWFFPFLSFFSFGTNALLNYILIPQHGMLGAAFASFVGLFLYSFIIQIIGFRYTTKKYNIITLSLYLVILIIVILFFIKSI